jgi:hypothetical protein
MFADNVTWKSRTYYGLQLRNTPLKRLPDWRDPDTKLKKAYPTALLIQMVGVEKEGDTACRACRMGKGPFKSCIVADTNDPNQQPISAMCANCRFSTSGNCCSEYSRSRTRAKMGQARHGRQSLQDRSSRQSMSGGNVEVTKVVVDLEAEGETQTGDRVVLRDGFKGHLRGLSPRSFSAIHDA